MSEEKYDPFATSGPTYRESIALTGSPLGTYPQTATEVPVAQNAVIANGFDELEKAQLDTADRLRRTMEAVQLLRAALEPVSVPVPAQNGGASSAGQQRVVPVPGASEVISLIRRAVATEYDIQELIEEIFKAIADIHSRLEV